MTPRQASKRVGVIVMAVVLSGCQSVRTTAAHKIADLLPRSLGPAEHYDVQVEGDTPALAQGRARRIHVVGEQVQLAPNTTVDTLDIDAHDVVFDAQAKRIERVGQTTFTGTVGQRNLTEYLAHRHPLAALSVQIRARDMQAEVPISAAGWHTTADVSGTLVPDTAQPGHLDFVADKASVGVLPIPAQLINFALGEINPVFDLSHEKAPITLMRADVLNGLIVLQGTANLNNFSVKPKRG